MADSDDELLIAAQRGSEEAFSRFYRRYERALAAFSVARPAAPSWQRI